MEKKLTIVFIFCMVVLCASTAFSQNSYELNSGWKCAPISKVKLSGEGISTFSYASDDWMDAVVPGTVLTSVLTN